MKSAIGKVTAHMVSSLDGYVASKDNSVEWMRSTDHYAAGVVLTEEDIATFVAGIDCYVIGSKTYEHALALGWPYGDTLVVVITSRVLPKSRSNVRFYDGDIDELVRKNLKSSYRNIWLAGGPALIKNFLRLGLVDELIVSILPVLLGEGKLFFDKIETEQRLHLLDTKAYKDGMVELHYQVSPSSGDSEMLDG